MDETRFLELARQVMSLPTAPYHERFVVEYALQFARRRSLDVAQDRCGNVLISYQGRRSGSRPAGLVATAHMDHPGAGFLSRGPDGRILFEKLGGVEPELALACGLQVYGLEQGADQVPWRARLREFVPATADRPAAFAVDSEPGPRHAAGPGSFAMWDLPAFRRHGRLLHSRACDDLGGVTAGLALLEAALEARVAGRVGLLLTRAEEGGFGGMLGAVQGRFLDRDALYVNIECSSAKAGAPLGAGPVVRVGDRRWVFDPAITAALTAAADELVAAGTGLQYQRKLLDGGTCEATVLMQAGFRSGAVALPLRHYHNHGGDRLRPEAVHLDDLRGLVVLLLYLAARPGGPAAALAAATAKLRGDMARSRQIMVPRLRGDRPRVRNQR